MSAKTRMNTTRPAPTNRADDLTHATLSLARDGRGPPRVASRTAKSSPMRMSLLSARSTLTVRRLRFGQMKSLTRRIGQEIVECTRQSRQGMREVAGSRTTIRPGRPRTARRGGCEEKVQAPCRRDLRCASSPCGTPPHRLVRCSARGVLKSSRSEAIRGRHPHAPRDRDCRRHLARGRRERDVPLRDQSLTALWSLPDIASTSTARSPRRWSCLRAVAAFAFHTRPPWELCDARWSRSRASTSTRRLIPSGLRRVDALTEQKGRCASHYSRVACCGTRFAVEPRARRQLAHERFELMIWVRFSAV